MPKSKPKTTQAPTLEEIARRAYDLFIARGGQPGHELDDWLQAESELLNKQRHAPDDGNNGSG
jgi:hypothetical protein